MITSTLRRGLLLALVLTMAAPLAAVRASDAPRRDYIVVLRDSAQPNEVAAEHARNDGARVSHVYNSALKGYAASIPEQAAARIAGDPRVEYVEEDGVVTASATQANPTWGLDRIDQRDLPLSSSYTYNATGAGVTAYIIDTGIRVTHSEFGGRAVAGYDAVTLGGSANDCAGHGTHVAGTVGGATYGVAKAVHLVAVRVLGCDGSGATSGVIAGVDWVTSNHTGGPAVANMSLGGGISSALDTAVQNSIADGITYAVSAGNGNQFGTPQNACNYSPARVATALTVGATDSTDKKASWSNIGTCLDIFGPGVSITSSWYSSNTATNTISGTSMASPHVAGVAALYLETNPSASAATVSNAVTGNATLNHVSSAGTGSANRLLYSGFIGGGQPVSPPAAPSNLSATAASSSQIGLTWTDNANNEDGFKVERSTNGGSTFTQIASLGANVTSFANTGLTASTSYVYRVRSYNSGGDSAFSNQSSATTNPPPANQITLTVSKGAKNRSITPVNLSWTIVTAGVRITRDGAVIASDVTGSSYTDQAKGGGSGTYQVCETADLSNCSNQQTAT